MYNAAGVCRWEGESPFSTKKRTQSEIHFNANVKRNGFPLGLNNYLSLLVLFNFLINYKQLKSLPGLIIKNICIYSKNVMGKI